MLVRSMWEVWLPLLDVGEEYEGGCIILLLSQIVLKNKTFIIQCGLCNICIAMACTHTLIFAVIFSIK